LGRRPLDSGLGVVPQLEGALAAGTRLGIADGDRANVAIVLGRAECALFLDPEIRDFQVREAGVEPASDLGGSAAESLVEPEGSAGAVGEQGSDRSVGLFQDNLLGDRLEIGLKLAPLEDVGEKPNHAG
jgi:hypothetical protein